MRRDVRIEGRPEPKRGMRPLHVDDEPRSGYEEPGRRIRSRGESVEEAAAAFDRSLRDAGIRVGGFLPGGGGAPPGLLTVQAAAGAHRHSLRKSWPVLRFKGAPSELVGLLPGFELAAFSPGAGVRPHPRLRIVLRKPDRHWSRQAVGAVSDTYRLVQHREAVMLCLRSLERAGLRNDDLETELAFSALGEWMTCSFTLPRDGYGYRDQYGEDMDFRCEITNAVDGSSSLRLWFGWFRLVCSNGMMIFGKHGSVRKIHRHGLDLLWFERRVDQGLESVLEHHGTLNRWQQLPASRHEIARWVDDPVERKWGCHRAARVFSICASGFDLRIPGATPGPPSRLVDRIGPGDRERVPGSPEQAASRFDVVQALSWVASRHPNITDRIRRQGEIPALLDRLPAASPGRGPAP